MTEQEEIAVELLKKAILDEKLSTYEYMKHLANCDKAALERSGWRNGNADAVLQSIKKSEQKIERMIQKHEREYP